MRIALLADIHANWEALEKVLVDARNQQVDKIWFLGDLVGRGPDPVEVLKWAEQNLEDDGWVLGNHDAMVADRLKEGGVMKESEWEPVNGIPRITIEKHREIISLDSDADSYVRNQFTRDRLKPIDHPIDNVLVTLVHGGYTDHGGFFRYPVPWYEFFLQEEIGALRKRERDSAERVVMCVGHTHVPMVVGAKMLDDWDAQRALIEPCREYPLDTDDTWIINPGSVGQPRDLNGQASYAILDTEGQNVRFRRVPYPWHLTAQKLLQQGYNRGLIKQLNDASLPDNPTQAPDRVRDYFERLADAECVQ